MKIRFLTHLTVLFVAGATTAFANVTVTQPANGAGVAPQTHFTATASATSCKDGVASMGIYIDDTLRYTTQGSHLDTTLELEGGSHLAVVQEWDKCGGVTKAPVHLTVGGTTLSNLQAQPGWNQWGELPPTLGICDAPCNGKVNWSMYEHQKTPSLSGNSTKFTIGGVEPYSDVLWSYPFIGDGAPAALKDHNHTLLPTVHNLSMDEQVFITNLAVTQSVELDVNIFMGGVGMEWGTQCNHLHDGAWDIWNNVDARWVATDIPCKLNNNAWNHVVLDVQRESNNDLLYKTITVNDVIYTINRTVAPFPVPKGWWGANLNFQLDGNYKESSYSAYVDNLSVTYW
jgi:hypothetical protein